MAQVPSGNRNGPKLQRRQFIKSGSAVVAGIATFGIPRSALSASMASSEIVRLDMTAGIEALKAGRVTSSQYCEAALKQYRKFKANNIFTQVSPEYVRSHAADVDSRRRQGKAVGPLHGLPYALKDSVDMVEYYTIAGHPALREFRPTVDADLVQILRGADGVCIGKTQIPPLSLWWTTENPMTGDTGNPFNSRYKTGGSSGGSGAAVAARIVPFAVAEDTGGSVRVPAAMNGVQGLRPTTGRWPTGGAMPIGFSDTLGPIARSIRDIKLLDSLCATDKPENVPGNVDLKDIRIGYQKAWFLESLHPWVETHFETTLERLSRAGLDVVPVTGIPGGDLHQLAIGILLADLPTTIAHYFNRHGVFDRSAFQLMHSLNIESIKNIWLPGIDNAATGEAYFELVERLRELRDKSQAVFQEHGIDALIYPTTKVPNTPNDGGETISAEGPLGHTLAETAIGENMFFAPSTRRPSIAMYSGMDPDGLPLSVTIDGESGGDRRLLDISEALERVLPALEEPKAV